MGNSGEGDPEARCQLFTITSCLLRGSLRGPRPSLFARSTGSGQNWISVKGRERAWILIEPQTRLVIRVRSTWGAPAPQQRQD